MTWNRGVRVEVPTNESGLLLMSVSRLSLEFGMARESVAKRLRLATVEPCDTLNGYAVYRLRDACEALVDQTSLKRQISGAPEAPEHDVSLRVT